MNILYAETRDEFIEQIKSLNDFLEVLDNKNYMWTLQINGEASLTIGDVYEKSYNDAKELLSVRGKGGLDLHRVAKTKHQFSLTPLKRLTSSADTYQMDLMVSGAYFTFHVEVDEVHMTLVSYLEETGKHVVLNPRYHDTGLLEENGYVDLPMHPLSGKELRHLQKNTRYDIGISYHKGSELQINGDQLVDEGQVVFTVV